MASRAVSLLALAAVLVALCAPAAAHAQGGPSAPGLGAPEPEETAPAPVTTDDPTDDGLETWQQVLIFAAGVVLLGGIAAAIMSDARRRAPTPRAGARPHATARCRASPGTVTARRRSSAPARRRAPPAPRGGAIASC